MFCRTLKSACDNIVGLNINFWAITVLGEHLGMSSDSNDIYAIYAFSGQTENI